MDEEHGQALAIGRVACPGLAAENPTCEDGPRGCPGGLADGLRGSPPGAEALDGVRAEVVAGGAEGPPHREEALHLLDYGRSGSMRGVCDGGYDVLLDGLGCCLLLPGSLVVVAGGTTCDAGSAGVPRGE